MKAETLTMILDSIADGVFTVDPDWRITTWNRAAQQITGFSRDEAVGSFCHDVFRSNVCQTGCVLRRTMDTGENLINFPINILTRDGFEKPVSVSTALLKDGKGNVVGGVETFRDLSALEHLRKRLRGQYSFEDIISKNHRIRQIFQILPDIAESESTVLIEGPSGSGKELFAHAIHNLSHRKDEPFVAVNCAALPDTLLESELFGYKAGAFTDARKDKPGRFAMAKGGTLFLDEIGDISAALQVKLLRVLQEKVYEPLGSSAPVSADVRIITATNKDLREEMGRGRFRDDLYYRLNVVRISLPPLSERKEDIPLLAEHFIGRLNAEKGREIKGLAPSALAALVSYDFPGNVRELENAVEHAFIMCKDSFIEERHFPPEIFTRQQTMEADVSLNAGVKSLPEGADPLKVAQIEVIKNALGRFDGHREKTAKSLGMHKTTLIRKMKKLGIRYP